MSAVPPPPGFDDDVPPPPPPGFHDDGAPPPPPGALSPRSGKPPPLPPGTGLEDIIIATPEQREELRTFLQWKDPLKPADFADKLLGMYTLTDVSLLSPAPAPPPRGD